MWCICYYRASCDNQSATTHDIWKFHAKLPRSHWYQPCEFPLLLTISAHC